MYIRNGALLHAPSDLVRFLGCGHATALHLLQATDPDAAPDKAGDGDLSVLTQKAGLKHEEIYRQFLEAKGGLIEIATTGTLEERAAATIAAMECGAQSIFQAAFLCPPWHGYADFLLRVEEPSSLGAWSYEPVDTKLARTPKASHIVQLGLYARMMEQVQGALPRRVHVATGDGQTHSFRLNVFSHVLRAAERRYLDFIASCAPASRPEPCDACDLCAWRDHCNAKWEASDHLSLVAGLGRPQSEKLRKAGIVTLGELATMGEGTRVPRMAQTTLGKLQAQARLQQARREGGGPCVEPLPLEEGRGFHTMPPPDPADLFFDLEGDPLEEGGLDYLRGLHFRDGSVPEFRFEWAHDHEAERAAFESMIDWIAQHLRDHPGAHVYHYAPYEITSLRRLSTLHASREDLLDDLLRQRRFVDLYGVLRQSIRTSEPDLSLKTMEIFFAEKRDQAVVKADQSIVEYKSWQETGDQAILDGILEYNRVDCENTEALRDWLVSLRMADLPWREIGPATPVTEEKTDQRIAAEEAAAKLINAILAADSPEDPRIRTLMAHLTQFHRRADKPTLWAMFDRCERDVDELVEHGECIGLIRPDGEEWLRAEKKSIIARYCFSPQDTKLREKQTVIHVPSLRRVGTVVSLDTQNGIVEVKRQLKAGETFPLDGGLMAEPTVNSAVLQGAIRRVACAWAGLDHETLEPLGEGRQRLRYRALLRFLGREAPALHDWTGGPLVQEGESFVKAATLRCLALDESVLFIQGPPGTGKTFTSAHVTAALVAAGKRVGISSNSHKAVNNLLSRVADICERDGVTTCILKKASRGNPDSAMEAGNVTDVWSNAEVIDYHPDVVGGTAWLFADPDMDQQFDYLFVDEAGQVAVANLIAMGASARNIVLVGDQMQLGQPIQGSHPGESGQSPLEYLLENDATVAPDRGILLDTSWRMHPHICGFISEAVYDGRLKAHPDCAQQVLHIREGGDPALASHGIRFVPMDHEGCGQRSDEEITRIQALCDSLIGTGFTDRQGRAGTIGWENILIVAPYNMQVNALKAALPEEAQIGTVDKFQGQEAEVVIVSMTTSSPDDLPRHVDFFYSKNRLNVAISRARTLALVIANPKLLELDAKSVEHLALVNTLAWVAEIGAAEIGGKL